MDAVGGDAVVSSPITGEPLVGARLDDAAAIDAAIGRAADAFPARAGDLLVLSLWTALGLVVTYLALARRR